MRGAMLDRHYQALGAGKQHDGCNSFKSDLLYYTLSPNFDFLSHSPVGSDKTPGLRLLIREDVQ